MPGPRKLYQARVKFSVTLDQARALQLAARYKGLSQGEFLREALDKHIKTAKLSKKRKNASEVRSEGVKRWKDEINLAWGAYIEARRKWYRNFRNMAAPAAPALTAKRRDLIMASLDTEGKEMTTMAGKGIWLSEFHTEKGFSGPEYAWRPANVQKFAQLVIDTRMGWE